MLARLENNAVAELRDIALSDVPLHKQAQWLPVVFEGDGPDLQNIIEPDRVRAVRSWPDLSVKKANLTARLNQDAENIRLKYITPGDGMALTYREKTEQAEEMIAAGQTAVDAMTFDDIKAQYPTIAAGIGKHGVTAWDVAQVVRAKYLQWAALSFEIEDRREGGIAAIAAATTAAEVQAAYDAVDWTGL